MFYDVVCNIVGDFLFSHLDLTESIWTSNKSVIYHWPEVYEYKN